MERHPISSRQLHICFFPLMSQGHVIPAIAMAKLFSSRGLKTTIVTTQLNAQIHSNSIQTTRDNHGLDIAIIVVDFPAAEFGLPQGFESPDSATTPEQVERFYRATAKLDEPLERLLREQKPDCLVADVFFPWATVVAGKFGIPRVVFHGTGFFSLCASLSVLTYEPYEVVGSDSEAFVVPNLPHEVFLTRNQLPPYARRNAQTEFAKVYKRGKESELGCFGVIVNSFYELEPDYADHYQRVFGRKAWHIGPLGENRGDKHECLEWLDSKKPNSVVYVCFGSMANFGDAQLVEIAAGLEASGEQFVWVVKREKKRDGVAEEWLPQGFEERIGGKGLIIRGWAPQVAILKHESVSAFVTHCGWNSTMEGVCTGKPMVTWPVSAEQFYNEKLVSRVLGIGVEVGARKWERLVGDFVEREAVEKAVNRVMGDEGEEMRGRARLLAEMASKAVEEGGSSYSDLNAFIEELGLFVGVESYMKNKTNKSLLRLV